MHESVRHLEVSQIAHFHLCVEGVRPQIKIALKSVRIGLCHLKNKVVAFKYFHFIKNLQTTWKST